MSRHSLKDHRCPRCRERTVAREGQTCFWCLGQDKDNRAAGWRVGEPCLCGTCVLHRKVYKLPRKPCTCKSCVQHRELPAWDQTPTTIAPLAKRTAK